MDTELVRIALSIFYLVTIIPAIFFIEIPDINASDDEIYTSLRGSFVVVFFTDSILNNAGWVCVL